MAQVRIVAGIIAFLLLAGGPTQAHAQDESAPATEAPVMTATAEPDEPGRLDVLVMLIAPGVRFRNIHLDVGDGAGGTQNRSFDTSAYFDFGWHLFVRPWGRRSPRPTLQAIVFQLDGGSAIGLTAEPAGSGITLQTNAWRMLGQFGYIYPFDRVHVGGLVGVGGDIFDIDPNLVLPSSRILYVRFGPAVVAPIVDHFLRFRADFGLRFPFALGGLEDAFGADSKALGLDGTLAFEGHMEAGFSYGLSFLWEYYRYRFAGPTMMVPAMGDGGEGSDHALTLQVLVGWSL